MDALCCFLTAMSGAVIHDPKDAPGRLIRFLLHDLGYQAVGGGNPAFLLAAAEKLGAVHVPGGQIRPGTFAEILMFYAGRTTGSGRPSGLFTASRLNAGFLIRGEDELRALEGLSLPEPGIKIEDTSCFGSKLWIARKDPTPMLPGTKGIGTQPRDLISCLISASDNRESGPRRCGSSQARAFTCTTTLGGKEGGPAAPRLFLQARQTSKCESFAPLAHDLAWRI